MSDTKNTLIKIAYENPELREDLLPVILKEAGLKELVEKAKDTSANLLRKIQGKPTEDQIASILTPLYKNFAKQAETVHSSISEFKKSLSAYEGRAFSSEDGTERYDNYVSIAKRIEKFKEVASNGAKSLFDARNTLSEKLKEVKKKVGGSNSANLKKFIDLDSKISVMMKNAPDAYMELRNIGFSAKNYYNKVNVKEDTVEKSAFGQFINPLKELNKCIGPIDTGARLVSSFNEFAKLPKPGQAGAEKK